MIEMIRKGGSFDKWSVRDRGREMMVIAKLDVKERKKKKNCWVNWREAVTPIARDL